MEQPAVEPISYTRRLADLAAAHPDEIAVVLARIDGSEDEITWGELDRRSNQIAHRFLSQGLGLGDRVAIGLRNSIELILVALGTWKVGATPVPLRWDLPEWERTRVLEVIDPKIHVDGESLDWLEATAQLDDSPVPDAIAPQTHGICSSGSTGSPKVVLIERPGTWDPTIGQPFPTEWQDIARPQVVMTPGPMYHTNGFHTLYNLIAGDRLIVLEKFDAARIVDLIERHKVTTITATSTMLQRIADLPGVDDRDLSSIAWVLQGAAVIAPSLVHRWIELIGADRFFMSYGMTEGLGLTALRADEWLAHPGTTGRGYRETQIRIVGPDGNELPTGEIGEIYLKSPSTGLYRYLGGGERQPATADGFSTGGDLGHVDEEGFLYIADRRVDMLVSGGANIYPAEVESALIDHPDIADIVVIGLLDDEWGRRVHAIVEPTDKANPPTADEVIAYAKTKLAAYKVPKTVEFVDAIPRSEATKVSRAALIAERGG